MKIGRVKFIKFVEIERICNMHHWLRGIYAPEGKSYYQGVLGPSIYDVHTEGRGVRLRWTHVDGGRGSSPMWTSTQKIKIRVH